MKLLEVELDFKKAHEYVIASLHDANNLSDEVSKVDFLNGSFFTFMPEGSVLDSVYNFETYLIYEENYKLIGVNSIRELNRFCLATLLLNEVRKANNICCVFDDFFGDPGEVLENDPLKGEKYSYNNQVYYILDKYKITIEVLLHYFHVSYAFWHSLCLLTSADLEISKDFVDKEKELSANALLGIASNPKLIIVGAYDGDGYVIWKRSDFDFIINWELKDEEPY